jgi:trimethylamine--corrinoid protein Co-methyltransferase
MYRFTRTTSTPRFHLLSKDALDAIHWATLDVLERTGIKIFSDKVLKMLEAAGCTINYEKKTAFISSYLVEESLKKRQKTVRLCARNPKYDLKLDGRHTYICTDGTGTHTFDFENGRRRESVKDDVVKSARISDYLDTINIYWPMVTSQDFPAHVRVLHDLEAAMNNTDKHVGFETTTTPGEAKNEIKIAVAVAGDEKKLRKRPIISFTYCSIAPLQHAESIEAVLEFVKAGIPVFFMSMPQTGVTGPVTIPGSLVVNNAETLAGIVISQVASPGSPVGYSSASSNFDMLTSRWLAGSPEGGIIWAALSELARYYGLPSYVMGFGSDAPVPGPQACWEKVISGLFPVLAGCDVAVGIGLVDACTALSFEQLVIDDEIVRMIFRLAEGIEVNDETLALDLIHSVGPAGQYLTEKHTLKHFKEHVIPEISIRKPYDTWKREGAKSVIDIAREKTKEILKTHQPAPLDKNVQKEIKEIIKRADKDLIRKT